MNELLKIIENVTAGKCYASYKYSLDYENKPILDYDNNEKFFIPKDRNGETDTSLKVSKSLKEFAKSINNNAPLFKYFLDGSRRVYKIDDIELNKNIYPIIGGQIGVACCERQSPSKFKTKYFDNDLVLALPNNANVDGGNSDLFFNSLTDDLNKTQRLKKYNLKFSKVLSYTSKQLIAGEKYENFGTAKIQDEMIECEKKIVALLTHENLLNEDNYLIKDGSLEYRAMKTGDYKDLSKIKSNYHCVVGVSKIFNPELCKDQRGRSNATMIAKLPLYHRTPAFMYSTDYVSGVSFSVWYLRIREMSKTTGAFAGILKLEKILVTENEIENGLNSDEIDLISANILNERNPVCYGNDSRWANHLYPIYLTETFIKCNFISNLHYLNLF